MRRVLVVDDHPDTASILAALILRMGHEARFATSCDEALEVVETFRPDIAFIDIAMPKVNGFECARRLLDKLGDPIRFIAISGYAPALWPQGPELFEKYLLKPVTKITLLHLIGEP